MKKIINLLLVIIILITFISCSKKTNSNDLKNTNNSVSVADNPRRTEGIVKITHPDEIKFIAPDGKMIVYDMPFSREYMRLSKIMYYKVPSSEGANIEVTNAIVYFLDYDETKKWVACWCAEGESGWIRLEDIPMKECLQKNNAMLTQWYTESRYINEHPTYDRHGPYLRITGSNGNLELWDDLSIKGVRYFLYGFMYDVDPIIEEIYYDFPFYRVYSIQDPSSSVGYWGSPQWNPNKDHFIAIGNQGEGYESTQQITVVQYMNGIYIKNDQVDTMLSESDYPLSGMSLEWLDNSSAEIKFSSSTSDSIITYKIRPSEYDSSILIHEE